MYIFIFKKPLLQKLKDPTLSCATSIPTQKFAQVPC